MNYYSSSSGSSIEHSARLQSGSEYLCWSRMQSEAGQGLDAIIRRKELERRTGGGMFLWGVGNAPATAISALARIGQPVPVVFSIMKGKPKAVDVAPARTVAWRRYFDATGVERSLPANAIVTSRADSQKGVKRSHYALMCFSRDRLALQRGTPFDATAFRNVGGVGAPVGNSQVTALLRQVSEPAKVSDYEINIRAWLAESYWVRLADPVEVTSELAHRLECAGTLDDAGWLALSADFRRGDAFSVQASTVPLLI